MPASSEIQSVFGYFQNLNLLGLIHDLRNGRVARQAWLEESNLCPIAHGLPDGPQVNQLRALGQSADLDTGCHAASRHIGAEPKSIHRFIRFWDEGIVSDSWLLQQLEQMWHERLADAEAVQAVLKGKLKASEARDKHLQAGRVV